MVRTKKIRYPLLVVLFLSLVGGFASLQASADETETMFERVGFTVRAKLPDNQIDKTRSFFNLKVEPGLKQTLEVEVINTSQEDREVQVELNSAMTNANGVVDYSIQNVEYDQSLEIPITEMASLREDTVIVKAGQTASVFIELDVPEQSFPGIVLGGLTFSEANSSDSKDSTTEGVSLGSQYAYTIGLVLTEGEELEVDNLNLLSVEPGVVEGRKVIQATIQNDQAKIIRGITVEAELFKAGSQDVLREHTDSNLEMAPNSNFPFAIPWGRQPLEQGDYLLKMKAYTDTDEWIWEEKFEVTSELVRQINQEAVDTITIPNWFKYTTIVGIGLSLTSLLIFEIRWKKLKEQV